MVFPDEAQRMLETFAHWMMAGVNPDENDYFWLFVIYCHDHHVDATAAQVREALLRTEMKRRPDTRELVERYGRMYEDGRKLLQVYAREHRPR